MGLEIVTLRIGLDFLSGLSLTLISCIPTILSLLVHLVLFVLLCGVIGS